MIGENFKKVLQECTDAKLVAVTKSRSVDEIAEVIEAGAQIIAENRIQEAKEKFTELDSVGIEKHLIGHLQTNKVRDAVRFFDVIQSVDSLRLAEAIDKEAGRQGKLMRILIQVNVSEDEAKSGALPEDLRNFYDELQRFQNLQIEGLMTITKNYEDRELVKNDFQKMKSLFDEFCSYSEISSPILSMGMSSDYKLAIECGSNMVRVGTAIFGRRV